MAFYATRDFLPSLQQSRLERSRLTKGCLGLCGWSACDLSGTVRKFLRVQQMTSIGDPSFAREQCYPELKAELTRRLNDCRSGFFVASGRGLGARRAALQYTDVVMAQVSISSAPYADLLAKVFDLTGHGLSRPLAEVSCPLISRKAMPLEPPNSTRKRIRVH